jgi:hypothetical protein
MHAIIIEVGRVVAGELRYTVVYRGLEVDG